MDEEQRPRDAAGHGEQRRAAWLTHGFEKLLHEIEGAADPDAMLFDVLIVGSGYGGAIAASELAGCAGPDGKRVRIGVLERGLEYLPGMFPGSEAELIRHVRFSSSGGTAARGEREGLLDLRMGPDVCALVANGLGGGSLINAGVLEEAAPAVFSTTEWPAALRMPGALTAQYAEAKQLLGATRNKLPNTISRHVSGRFPLKHAALERLDGSNGKFRDVELGVAMEDGPNAADVELSACNLCGDCATGCNFSAKNSLDENLLVQARRRGVELFTGATVLQLEKVEADAGWVVHTAHTDEKRRKRQHDPARVRARRVILAAGTFGSTEILLRSRSEALEFSTLLGQRFSGNGDLLAVSYGEEQRVNAVARETDVYQQRCVGPTITGMIDQRRAAQGIAIQEFSIPGPLRRLFAEVFTTAHMLGLLATTDKDAHTGAEAGGDPCAVDDGKIDRSQIFGVMGHDGAGGRMELIDGADGDGGIVVRWPELRASRRFKLFDEQESTLATLLKDSHSKGELLSNPLRKLLPHKLESLLGMPLGPALTTHPLGGCRMADGPNAGVVDQFGQVFDPRGSKPHAGLVVLDGSVLPTSLGINPSLTIAALALRAVRQLRANWGLHSDASLKPDPGFARRPIYKTPVCASARGATRVQFIERMSGEVELGSDTYVAELTMQFHPTRMQPLMRCMQRKLRVDPRHSRVRIFRRAAWDTLKLTNPAEQDYDNAAVYAGTLQGELQLLHRERSTACQRTRRALWAWLRNRGLRDVWQAVVKRLSQRRLFYKDPNPSTSLLERIALPFRLASRAGEVRLFEYRLRVDRTEVDKEGLNLGGRAIEGRKRVTYARRANPWRQLSELELTAFPALRRRALLKLDLKFLAGRGVPLMQIVRQRDHATALLDVASFVMYFTRLSLSLHVWSFRKPDEPELRVPNRLPGKLPGIPRPEIHEIEVGRLESGKAVVARLTRYRRYGSPQLPVVMFHGYSASGTSFAHHAVNPNLASYLWQRERDVWVADLRTSSGMPTAKLPWAFEDAALADLPATIAYVLRETGSDKLDVVAHCMGAAMFSMAILSHPEAGDPFFEERERLPQAVNSVVLSQVGPAVVFSPANVFRAYAVGYLREVVKFADYQFRPERQATIGDQLLDRLLATLPYPVEEFDIENPRRPCIRTPFVGTRHRMDALYGRDFNLVNVDRHVMDHIDDLFGPLNMQTVLQAIHFARASLITDRAGRNVYVTRQALAQRWKGIPTLSIHGEKNGLADVATVQRMYAVMDDAKVDVFRWHIEPDHGHQDCLIGRDAQRVFERIEAFLQSPTTYESSPKNLPPSAFAARMTRAAAPAAIAAAASPPAQLQPLSAEIPWIGPVRGTYSGGLLEVAVASDPQIGDPLYVTFVPVKIVGDSYHVASSGQPSFPYEVWTSVRSFRGLLKFELQWPVLPPDAVGVLVMLVYDMSGGILKGPPAIDDFPRVLQAVTEQLSTLGYAHLEDGLMQGPAPSTLQRQQQPRSIHFALGSCQYPSGPFDVALAQASYERLNNRVMSEEQRLQFLVLAGDQVYVDATAGLFDPSIKDDRYVLPYEKFLRIPPVRSVFRRLNVYAMLDDHEIEDNWEPGLHDQADDDSLLRNGREAYVDYQRRTGPPLEPPFGDSLHPLWYQSPFGGFDFFFADTRTERKPRSPRGVQSAHIMSDGQFEKLSLWIAAADSQTRRPRFIVSPSILLPRRLTSAEPGNPAAALHSDAWDGYPDSLHRVLGHVARADGNFVFLSGDEHLSCVARIELTRSDGSKPPVIVYSIHCSGLYSPFTFANGAVERFAGNVVKNLPPLPDTNWDSQHDLLTQDCFAFSDPEDGAKYECRVITHFALKGSGFGLLSCSVQESGGWLLDYEFSQTSGSVCGQLQLR